MNKVIARTMLALVIIFLTWFYVLKYIFPEFLLLQVTDPNVLKVGEFIESWEGYKHIYYCLSSFLTFYLFTCASSGKFKLTLLEFIYIVIAVALCKVVAMFLPELYVHVSTSVMFILAVLCKGKLAYATTSFAIHGLLSQFVFSIRGFGTIVGRINIASSIVLSLECFMWLLLLSLIFYFKEAKNGSSSTISK